MVRYLQVLETANPSQGGDAKPWVPLGSPGRRKVSIRVRVGNHLVPRLTPLPSRCRSLSRALLRARSLEDTHKQHRRTRPAHDAPGQSRLRKGHGVEARASLCGYFRWSYRTYCACPRRQPGFAGLPSEASECAEQPRSSRPQLKKSIMLTTDWYRTVRFVSRKRGLRMDAFALHPVNSSRPDRHPSASVSAIASRRSRPTFSREVTPISPCLIQMFTYCGVSPGRLIRSALPVLFATCGGR